MEELVGPVIEVILTVKEVTGITFVNGPVFAVAKFSDNEIETDILECDTVVRFNTDLIWETNKQNIRRMRNSNIPIKLQLCKFVNDKQSEKIGYVIVNLKTAQYIPKGKSVRVREELVKVLGLGKEAKGCCPQILLSLKIRDKVSDLPNEYENIETYDGKYESCGDAAVEQALPLQKDEPFLEDNAVVNEMGDVKEMVSIPLPSQPLISPQPPPASRSPRTKHSITSKLTEERPCITGYEAKNSTGDVHLQKKFVEAYHNFILKVHLASIIWYKAPQKFRFRFHQSRSEIFSTTHPEIQVSKGNEAIQLCDIKATFNLVETPVELHKLLHGTPPMVSVFSTIQNRPVIIARGILQTDNLKTTGDEITYEIELTDVKNHEAIGKLTYAASLTDGGPQLMKDVTLKFKPEMDEEDLPPAIFGSYTDKIVDELQDWKEHQKQIYQKEFTKKLQKEISDLREDWMERRKELEEKLSQKMEQCRILGNSLISATEDVKQKSREFTEKEKSLEITKGEIELRYLKLLTDKNDEAEKLKNEYFLSLKEKDMRISALEAEKLSLENRVAGLQKEIEDLKAVVKSNESEIEKNKRACLSQEQTATLLQDLKTMQEKLETANNSKLFFKEQWGRAVREIHRIKSEFTKNIQVQLQYRKDELKKLGLEQFLTEKKRNNLERDDVIEAKDFLGTEFEAKTVMSDIDLPYTMKSNNESFKTMMDMVKESNTYLLKFNQETEDKIKKLIEERDRLLCEQNSPVDEERIAKLNKEIRHLLDH